MEVRRAASARAPARSCRCWCCRARAPRASRRPTPDRRRHAASARRAATARRPCHRCPTCAYVRTSRPGSGPSATGARRSSTPGCGSAASTSPRTWCPVRQANIGGSGKVRAIIIDDLKAMATAARKAGKGIAVRSAYRSYSSQKSVFDGWVASRDTSRRSSTARDPATPSTSWARPSTSGAPPARRRPGTTTTGRPAAGRLDEERTPGSTAS